MQNLPRDQRRMGDISKMELTVTVNSPYALECFSTAAENSLISLDRRTFIGLTSLLRLLLVNNKIRTIDHYFLDVLPKLYTLHLSGNSIRHLGKDMFASNSGNSSALYALDLGSNYIHTMHRDCFGKHIHLHTLHLRHNKVSSI